MKPAWILAAAIVARGAESRYIDAAACRGCHREIFDAFRATGMGRSIELPSALPELLAQPVEVRHAGSNSRFTIRRGVVRHEETGLAATIAAFIGSGIHSRTPVHRKTNGKFAELPVSHYAERGGYWAMSPGFDRADHSGMRREMSDGCLFCHTAYPAREGELAAIDCQRCHGPGENHARKLGAIVNPAKLAPARRIETCLQCHLETGTRTTPDAIRRVGRAPYSYRPGEPLGDFQIYFAAEAAPADDGIPVNGAGSGLLASACFQRSGGKLLCTTCHDPHGVRKSTPDAPCLGCHQRAHAENRGSCTGCHMPKRRTEDAVHVIMTDHRIRRNLPAGDPRAPKQERHGLFSGPVRLLYPPVLDPTPETRAYLGIAAKSAPLLTSAVKAMAAPPAEFLYELGRLDATRASEHWRRAVAADPAHAASRLALSEWLIRNGRAREAVALIEAAPVADPKLLNSLAVALVSLERFGEAVKVLDRAVAADDQDPLTHLNLGVAREASGDREGALRAYRRALRLQPDLARAREGVSRISRGGGVR